jgi:hypothetical protein
LGLWLLGVALLVCGCGGGTAAPPRSKISLESPAVGADGVISPRVSCGAGTIWLPLKWGALPSGTKELVLYFGWFKDEGKGGERRIVVPFGSVIGRIKTSIHGTAANTLPPGASWSYFTLNNCQPVREGQDYLVELFALDHPPHAIPNPLKVGFVTGITEEALGMGRFAGGSAQATKLSEEALAVGHFTATYGPKRSLPEHQSRGA